MTISKYYSYRRAIGIKMNYLGFYYLSDFLTERMEATPENIQKFRKSQYVFIR